MKRSYDFIVLGCGGLGSAAVYWLARQAGERVLGLEQFRLGHEKGDSQDHSRIIRLSYDDPAYAAAMRRQGIPFEPLTAAETMRRFPLSGEF